MWMTGRGQPERKATASNVPRQRMASRVPEPREGVKRWALSLVPRIPGRLPMQAQSVEARQYRPFDGAIEGRHAALRRQHTERNELWIELLARIQPAQRRQCDARLHRAQRGG